MTDGKDLRFAGKSAAESIRFLRSRTADPAGETLYLGLTQIPSFALKEIGIAPEIALDKCSNLEIGYTLFLGAHSHASTVEKSPWKTTSVAYAYFRTRQTVIDAPYAKKATDYLMKEPLVPPAGMNDPIYHAVAAEWSAGMASRHSMRNPDPGKSLLALSGDIAKWARLKY